MTLRHPWQVAIAIVSTFIAATLQLFIPRLLGQAVDQAQGVMAAGAGAAAEHALWTTALILLGRQRRCAASSPWLQNYYGESVGHHTGYELRLAFYEKIQRLSFSFHDRVHTGDLITLGMLDLDGVRMFFSTGLVRVVLLDRADRRRRLSADLAPTSCSGCSASASCRSSPGAPRSPS